MAIIPSGTQFIGLASTVNTIERRSSLINNESAPYTMQDIIDTVSPSISANPSVIDLKVTDGTAVTGTTIGTISQSLLIPANTFTSAGGMLEFMARFQKTGTAGNYSSVVFLNTSINITGASQVAWFSNSSNTFVQGLRTARISSNTLNVYQPFINLISDYIGGSQPQTSVSFDPTVDNYLIFVIYLFNAADSAVVEMARAVKYE